MRKFLRLLSLALSLFFRAAVAVGAKPEAKFSAALPKRTKAFATSGWRWPERGGL